jgi:Xaa-Pro aminopeptidase
MTDRTSMATDDRKMFSISVHELQRRWALVREHMEQHAIDALIVQNEKDFTGGYVKWLTDIPAAYPRTVIFYLSDLMTVVEHGPAGKRRELGGKDPNHPGVGEILTTAAFPSVTFTQRYDAEAVCSVLRQRGYRRLALVGADAMPHGFVNCIQNRLSGAVWLDETDFMDRAKALKSPEEIDLIKHAAEMQDRVFERLLSQIRPGMRDSEFTALAQYEGQVLGSEQGIFLGMSAKIGTPSAFVQRHFQGRTFRQGDYFPLLIENSGPGGFYTELARTIVLGRASQELTEGFEIVKHAQEDTLKQMRPGAECATILAAHNERMEQRGAPPDTRLYSHGQGYDLVERPIIRDDETMALEMNMNMSVHPAYATHSMFTVICDNYLVEEHGVSECLHRTPKKLFEL